MDAALVPRITLHILRGRASQKSRAMAGPTLLIGSDARCDVQMRSAAVAPRHCLITRRDGRAIATRLSADHPILLNGHAIAEEEIKDGDSIALGPFALRVEFNGEEAVVPATPVATSKNGEPPAVHRPRFALLDRKPTAPIPIAVESAPTALAPAPPPAPYVPEAVVNEAQEEIARERERLKATAGEQEARDQELREKDERLQEWERRLEAQEAELERTRGELAATVDDCRRRRKTLEERRARLLLLRTVHRSERREAQSRFAKLLGDAERRAKELDERESEIAQRDERWQRIAEEIEARQAAAAEREREAAAALDDLERRRQALQRERALLDKEWQRLFARQQEVVEQQAILSQRAERVAAEEAVVADARQRSQSELRRLQAIREEATVLTAELDVKTVKVRGRERALDERARQLSAAEGNLQEREAELNSQAEEIHRRAAEVQSHLDAQQRTMDDRRAELDEAFQHLDAEKQDLQERQAAWKAEVAALSKAKEDLDQRISLLAARERALVDLEQKGHDPAELERRYKELRREQDKLAADAVEAANRRRKLDEETTKLAEIARELTERQRELTERERQLTEAAARGQEELDREAERLQQEQASLDAKAEEQRQRWDRLKASAVRIGSRRKVLLERLTDSEARFEECRREIEALVENRRRLRASLEEYALQTEERERAALEWLRGVRAESDAVADAHRRFTRQFDTAVGRAAPTSLRATLGDWWNRMSRLQRRLAGGEQVLTADGEGWVDAREVEEESNGERAATNEEPRIDVVTPPPYPPSRRGEGLMERRGEGLNRALTPNPSPATGEGDRRPLTPNLSSRRGEESKGPPRWLFKLVELGIADEEVLNYLLVSARERGAAVEELLIEQGVATRYQIECVSEGRFGDLQIGSAQILDLIHHGAVATTYRAMVAPIEKPVVLRLLHANVVANEAVKKAYLDHARGAMRFRHPAAAAVLAPFEHEGRVGVIAEFAGGRPLLEVASAKTPNETVGCFRQCLAALFAGQRAGLLHRSLRPSRIMVSSLGRTVLLGFGEPDWLVRLHRCEKGPEADYYVAPEEAAGRPFDARADLFSLCRIFLEIVLGRRPDAGESVTVPTGYPDALLELLLRGVHGDPSVRCRSFADVIHAVDRLADGGAPTARRAAPRAAA